MRTGEIGVIMATVAAGAVVSAAAASWLNRRTRKSVGYATGYAAGYRDGCAERRR